jgi:putative transposase
LDGVVEPFRKRPLKGRYPFVWLDALYLKVCRDHRIVSQALIVAIGVQESGERQILGFCLGASEGYAFWLDFLRSLTWRGLRGVELVTGDAHEGLKGALGQAVAGVSWQCCRVHFVRNLLAHVPRGGKSIVAAALRTIFAQPERQAAELLAQAEDDILAYMALHPELWARIYSTNPLERVKKEGKGRTKVVGVFPDGRSATRLVGAVLLEIGDEWQVGRRYFRLETMARLIEPEPLLVGEPPPLHLAPV